jgi:hypothetical protein
VAKGRFTKNKPLTDEKVSSLKTFAEYIDGILNGIYSDLGLNPSGEDRRLILETLVEEEILDAYRLAKKGDVKSPV